MPTWCSGVRAAQRVFEDVEKALRENSVRFQEIDLYPYRTNGGRSDGVTAWFQYDQRHICISLFEHWNSGNICMKISEFTPVNMFDDHDIADIEFRSNEVEILIWAIQSFLCRYFGLDMPKPLYIPSGYKGISDAHPFIRDIAADRIQSLIEQWSKTKTTKEKVSG